MAARLKEQLAPEAAKRRGARRDIPVDLPGSQFGEAREKAAVLMNVSPSLVQLAARVLKSGDAELIRAVQSGELSVWAAAKRLRAAPHSETAPAEQGRYLVLSAGGDGGVMLLWAPVPQLAEIARLAERRGFRDRADTTDAPAVQ